MNIRERLIVVVNDSVGLRLKTNCILRKAKVPVLVVPTRKE